MVSQPLEIFVDAVMERGEITQADMRHLHRDVLPQGPTCRDEVDVLVALDRAVASKAPTWSAFLMREVIDFVVWQSRPTGIIDRETAYWLTTSLGCGTGPSDLAVAIAFEIVRECEQADEVLITFLMRFARGRRTAIDLPPIALDQAA